MSESDTTLRTPLGGMTFPPVAGSDPVVTNPPTSGAGADRATPWFSLRVRELFLCLWEFCSAGISLVGARLDMLDPDTWWHIAVGQRIMDTHVLPTADFYSFTAPGTHWIAYEWLGEMAMAFAARMDGLRGLANLQILLVAIVTVLLYYYAYVRCGNWKAACVATGLFLPIASVIFTLRPQLFGYVFLLITFICLEKFRQGHSRALWILPPLMVVWINTHGTFVFGMAMMAAYYAGGLFKFELGGLVAEPWTKRQRVQLLTTIFLCSWRCSSLLTERNSPPTRWSWPPASRSTSPTFRNGSRWPLIWSSASIFWPWCWCSSWPIFSSRLNTAAGTGHPAFCCVFRVRAYPLHADFRDGHRPDRGQVHRAWMPRYDPDKEQYALNLTMIAIMLVGIANIFRAARRSPKSWPRTIRWAAVDICGSIRI